MLDVSNPNAVAEQCEEDTVPACDESNLGPEGEDDDSMEPEDWGSTINGGGFTRGSSTTLGPSNSGPARLASVQTGMPSNPYAYPHVAW